MSLDEAMKGFCELFPDRDTERWIRAVAEEAGEVVGAFNKWHDGNKIKPKSLADVVEEMVQLYSVLLLAASKLGVHHQRMEMEAEAFLNHKAEQIMKIRAGEWPVEPILPKPHTKIIDGKCAECEEFTPTPLSERLKTYRMG